MGLSIVTAHAATVTGTVSSGNEYRYHEDKTPVSLSLIHISSCLSASIRTI